MRPAASLLTILRLRLAAPSSPPFPHPRHDQPSSPLPLFTREDLALPPEELPSDSLLSGLFRNGLKLAVVPPAKNAERVSSASISEPLVVCTLVVTVVCSSWSELTTVVVLSKSLANRCPLSLPCPVPTAPTLRGSLEERPPGPAATLPPGPWSVRDW
ncbi:unnamed protein product [Danaus chrysippus]|uniref:(African queen) hypothetical protein n=1 Tax=Danaus chrysippus TaxID=151541 RepID=A0A8J2W0Y6_9NEOP|nr:unnamed protein product [Danaus chrysippus]